MSDKNNTFIILRVTKDFKNQVNEKCKELDINLSEEIRNFLIDNFELEIE